MKTIPLLLIFACLSGCYAKGNSHFLGSGKIEYFFTMGQCQEEASATHKDGSPKYSGYECRSQFLWFTLGKREYYEGTLQSATN